MKWKSLTLVVGVALAPLAGGVPVAAQQVGVGVGFAGLPRIFEPGCGANRGRDGYVSGGMADLVGSLPLGGRFGAEARLGVYAPLNFEPCLTVTAPASAGAVGQPVYPSDGGATLASDLRLWYAATPRLIIAAGPGWLWTPQAPYLAISPTLRVPTGRAHFVASVDWLLGWFPHDLVVNEFLQNDVTIPLSSTTVHEWRSIVALRAGIELNVH